MSRIPSPDPRFAIRLVHLAVGWRYWARHRSSGHDQEIGLDVNGYATSEAAQMAIVAIAPTIPAHYPYAAPLPEDEG